MGKFANTPAEMDAAIMQSDPDYVPTPTYLGPRAEQVKLEWHGESGFEAMGHQVPAFRKTAAEAHMKAMGFDKPGDSERRYDVIARMAQCVERDNSHEALELALKAGVDATGCYRILSVLLCEPEPAPEPEPEATYVDLMVAA